MKPPPNMPWPFFAITARRLAGAALTTGVAVAVTAVSDEHTSENNPRPIRQTKDTQARRHAGTQAHRHAGTQARRSAGRQARRQAGTQARRQARRHAGTQARRHTGRHARKQTPS